MEKSATAPEMHKPFDKFKDLVGGLFTVSKSELDAKVAEEAVRF